MAPEDLDERIAELQTLRRERLLEDWEDLWKRKPPKNISRVLLIRSIAYKLQEQIYDGLSPSCRKALNRLIKSAQRTGTGSRRRGGRSVRCPHMWQSRKIYNTCHFIRFLKTSRTSVL